MAAARARLISDKFLLAGMPAFLDFCPRWAERCFRRPWWKTPAGAEMTPEDKTTVNYWFRHVWEFINPIMPGLLLFSQITQFPLSTLMLEMAPFTVAAIIIGLDILPDAAEGKDGRNRLRRGKWIGREAGDQAKGLHAVALTAGPILFNIFLVMALKLPASVAMASVVGLMAIILRQDISNIKKMLIHGLDRKLLWGIGSVLLFQQVLLDTGALTGVVAMLRSSQISPLIIAGVLTFVTGMLTGTSGGFVAVSMPVVVALAPGEIAAAVVGTV